MWLDGFIQLSLPGDELHFWKEIVKLYIKYLTYNTISFQILAPYLKKITFP